MDSRDAADPQSFLGPLFGVGVTGVVGPDLPVGRIGGKRMETVGSGSVLGMDQFLVPVVPPG